MPEPLTGIHKILFELTDYCSPKSCKEQHDSHFHSQLFLVYELSLNSDQDTSSCIRTCIHMQNYECGPSKLPGPKSFLTNTEFVKFTHAHGNVNTSIYQQIELRESLKWVAFVQQQVCFLFYGQQKWKQKPFSITCFLIITSSGRHQLAYIP